jgi:hypothetical protein
MVASATDEGEREVLGFDGGVQNFGSHRMVVEGPTRAEFVDGEDSADGAGSPVSDEGTRYGVAGVGRICYRDRRGGGGRALPAARKRNPNPAGERG